MSSFTSSPAKLNALEAIKSYRVSELQAILHHANLSRHGHKRDLFQRCKDLINSNFTTQLANKIQQINNTRSHSTRSHHVSSSSSSSRHHPIVLPKTPPMEVLPPANHIQFVSLPFFEKMRTIESTNVPVDWHTFSPIRFSLNETDIDLIRKSTAKVFLRIAPTVLSERHNDVLPPYLFVQCNNQPVINNNVSKQVGAQAHSTSFPTDITDKLILKANTSNTLTFFWLQSPTTLQLKNLPRSYTLAIQLVHCVSMNTIFDVILKREPLIKKTDDDSDIEIEDLGLMTTRHRVSLLCPITQSLIVVPAKSAFCSHLTCFDLKPFLLMNERRLQWTCPLCKKSASYESLRIDERLQSILSSAPANCSTVELDSSTGCQYILDNIKQEKIEPSDSTHTQRYHEDGSGHDSSTGVRRLSAESDCIVLSSGSESEEGEENDNDDEIDNSPGPGSSRRYPSDDLDERRTNKRSDTPDRSSRASQSTPSPVISTAYDGDDWENTAQITYDLSSDLSEALFNRKRSNSSRSSVLSSSSSTSSRSHDDRHRRKRNKQATNVEVITLSSSDSASDNDDYLS